MLEPTMFVLFINDLPQVVEVFFIAFQSDVDRQKLQQYIDQLTMWLKKFQLTLNESKWLWTIGRKPEHHVVTAASLKLFTK